VEDKNLMQTSAKFCEVYVLYFEFASFSLSTKLFLHYLSVVQVLSLPFHQTSLCFAHLHASIGRKNSTSKSVYINAKDT